MTAMPEAKLAREAELPYALLALATDYDCWHESEEDVTRRGGARRHEEERRGRAARGGGARPRPPRRRCQSAPPGALAGAVMTARDRIPPAALARLDWLVGKYLEWHSKRPPLSTSANPLLIVGSIAFDDLDMPTGRAPRRARRRGDVLVLAASLLAPGAIRVVGVVGERLPRGAPGRPPRARRRHRRRRARRGQDLPLARPLLGATWRAARRSTRSSTCSPTSPRRSPRRTRRARSSCSATSTRRSSSTCSSRRSSRKLVAADTMNFWIERRAGGAGATCSSASICSSSTTRRRGSSRACTTWCGRPRTSASAGRRRSSSSAASSARCCSTTRGRSSCPPTRSRTCSIPPARATRSPGGSSGYLAARGEVTPGSLRKALLFASALGSFCVEGIGPSRLLSVGRPDLAARMAAFAQLVDYGGDLVLPG